MSNSVFLATALRLPAVGIDTLGQGRAIATIVPNFLNVGQSFVLCKSNETSAQFWARCETCKSITNAGEIAALSKLIPWTEAELAAKLNQNKFLLLAFLRVYQLPKIAQVVEKSEAIESVFLPLVEPLMLSDSQPILSDRTFTQRKQQLENLEPPLHPELEELLSAIASLTLQQPEAQTLDRTIKSFLGWTDGKSSSFQIQSELDWIERIVKAGNSSDGHEFEKLVRKSLIQLGFSNSGRNPKASLDPNSTGGAAGVDVYCELPYSLVGECKASKYENLSNKVSHQLIHLGGTELGKAEFDRSVKVIFAAGELTGAAEKAAIEHGMNIMRPETLQRLVKMSAKYPGSINLFDLKICLDEMPFGQASDHKLQAYLDQIEKSVKLRSHIISIVKEYQERTNSKDASVNDLHVAYVYSNPTQPLEKSELRDILIELSSPLNGYLGRDKKSDRFYFLRPLNYN